MAKGAFQLALGVASHDYALDMLFEKFSHPSVCGGGNMSNPEGALLNILTGDLRVR